jgi:hypothetical protein
MKKMVDEVIREVWQAKDAIAKEFNYDIRAFAAEIQTKQRQSGRRIVNLAGEARTQSAAQSRARPGV